MAKTLTPGQEKLVDIVVANRLAKGKSKSKKQMLVEAGFSPKGARVPQKYFDSKVVQESIKQRTEETVKRMEAARSEALGMLSSKIKKATYSNLVNGIDILTKNSQLLSGKATENKAIHIEISEHIASKNEDGPDAPPPSENVV